MWSFGKGQPEVPADVALFLENERGRAAYELDHQQTTDNRGLIDESIQAALTVAERLIEDPSDENLEAALVQGARLQTAFVTNTIQEATPQLAAFLLLPPAERAKDAAFIEKSTSIGKFILHGLKVARWTDRHKGAELVIDNVISATVASALAEALGDTKKVKRLGKLFYSVSIPSAGISHD